jgi:hypothetical protein
LDGYPQDGRKKARRSSSTTCCFVHFQQKGTFWQILEMPEVTNFHENLFSHSQIVSRLHTEAAILVGGQQRFECAGYL